MIRAWIATGHAAALVLMLGGVEAAERHHTGIQTSQRFTSANLELQQLYDAGTQQLQNNLKEFAPGLKVLVEGGGYDNAWLETQPMGGEMFATQNLQIALNNQVLFMLTQREDGRLPGMVLPGSKVAQKGWEQNGFPKGHVWFPDRDLVADYEMFQGYCFPEPAWRMYFWVGKDKAYLNDLYQALKGNDAYLWRVRDSNGDGILETWCVWDTGEDGSTRLHERGMPENWPYESAPGADAPGIPKLLDGSRAPFQSMDIMAYSYSGRAVLSKLSRELGNGEADQWHQAAENVRRRVIEMLWDPKRHACFDRDRDGKVLPELIHNNLRCMWYGMFTQEMADAFIKHHLLNPDAFWTPVPLVSIAVNEPLFLSKPRNNWSGQPQGLTYQRAIHALERYGHVAEVSLLGRKLLPVLIRNGKFSQQIHHESGVPSLSNSDGYGPMILAMQGYVSRMHGVHIDVENGRVWWSGLDDGSGEFQFQQTWGKHDFKLVAEDGWFRGWVGGAEVFRSRLGTRVVTDLEGKPLRVMGISPEKQAVHIRAGGGEWSGEVLPNQELAIDGDRFVEVCRVAFDYPHPNSASVDEDK